MEKLSHKENPIYLFWQLLWAFGISTGILALIISFFSMNTGMTGATPGLIYAMSAFGAAVILPIYTLPSYFAFRKRMKRAKGLLVLNLLLGWTVIGYLICVIRVRMAEMPR